MDTARAISEDTVMKTSGPIVGFLLGFEVTLFLLQWNGVPLRIMLWTIVLFLALIGIMVELLSKKRTGGWTIVAVGIGMSVAILRITMFAGIDSKESIKHLPDNTKAELTGWISEVPDRRPVATQYVMDVQSIVDGTQAKHIDGKVLIVDRATWPAYDMGDYVTVRGVVTVPQGSDDFDYAKYLSVKHIDRTMDRASIALSHTNSPPPWNITYSLSRFLFPVRTWFERRITRIFPEPHASLLIGLLTGGRAGLPQDLSEDFRIAGLSHIVAISGYNITIILTLLSSSLFFLPLKKRFWPLSLGITVFVLFVGAGAPVVRAGIMGVLGLIAIQANRIAKPRLLILWTAFFMSTWNPLSLWYDAGFQLSFLATIGIAELGPYLKRLCRCVPESFGMRESLATTIAAEIATLPVTMLLFRQLSLIAPLSNLLVAPLIPLAMLTGFVATLLGALYEPLGLLGAIVPWGILSLIVHIVRIAASVPLAVVQF